MASRRTVLKLAAATGALAGVSRTGATRSGTTQVEEIELDAQVSGWVGRSPPAIADAVNPALSLEAGRTYRVRWTNADGLPHNFALLDADGGRVLGSDIVDGQGATRTVEFEATAAMATYQCDVHPQTMRGAVAVGGRTVGNGTGPADGEPSGNGSEPPAEQGPPPVLDETTVVLGALVPYWLGLAPAGIRNRTNPTLRLRAGAEYEFVWMNLDGVEHDFHLLDSTGDDVADTSSREDVGDTHSTDADAEGALATYRCAFHPQSMRGGVEVV